MLKRDITFELNKWLKKTDRKPLILNGARQVGKTSTLKHFAEQNFKKVIYVNFERQKQLSKYFESSIDPLRIIENLSIYFQMDVAPKTTCFIFDEIQECPAALNSLKYFCEELPQYAVMGAGSLLGVKLAKEGFPVGKVEFLNLKPLSFFEYLDGLGHGKWRQYLENVCVGSSIPEPMHEEIIRELQFYLFVGGMPAVVQKYADTNSLNEAREIQNDIISAYQLDFAKHAPGNQVVRISEVWSSTPAQLAKENKKFVYSVISNSARGRDYEQAIEWLRQAGLINKIKRVSTPKIPLSAYAQHDAFKAYMLDVGLLGALANLPSQIVVQQDELFSEFKGALIENFVVQEVFKNTVDSLYYWSSDGKAEIDLLIQNGLETFPLEIKSGNTRHKKSLLVYQDKFNPALMLRTNPRNFKREENLLNIPLYLISRVQDFLNMQDS